MLTTTGLGHAAKADDSPAGYSTVVHYYNVRGGPVDSAGAFPDDTDEIQTWYDSAGSEDPTQGTSARRPTYDEDAFGAGRPGVRFDTDRSSSDYNSLDTGVISPTVSQACTQFIVCKIDEPGSDALAVVGDWKDGHVRYHTSGKWLTTAGSNLSSASDATTDATVLTVKHGGTGSEISINGAVDQTGNSGTNAINRIVMGHDPHYNNSFLDGWLGDYVITGDISDSDRDSIEDYLGDKYGIAISH